MTNLSVGLIPTPEAERMAAVRRYDILDTPPDGSFDRITALAARQFNVPIAIISIVDHDRIWFKSRYGLPINELPRDEGLCATTILSAYPRVLTDTKEDTCAMANPLVAGEFGLRFYAGVPLRTYDGHNLGTLCVLDTNPRPVEQSEIEDLSDLASVVMDQLELRISARQAIAREKLLAREIDHRVMNSLQFISSMLTLQSHRAESSAARLHLQQAANRVIAVAQVHKNFYAHAAEAVSCLAFLQRLSKDLSEILGRAIEVSGDDDLVPTTLIQPIGLIANEMVTNAAKYGIGEIELSFRRLGGDWELRVSNHGKILPVAFDPRRSNGLGMRVITSLTQQLQGDLAAAPLPTGSGASFSVTFPVQHISSSQ